MIRPVLYVDLPGIFFALDRRARAGGHSLADFVTYPQFQESHSGIMNFLIDKLPLRPALRTWIAEDHWRIQGIIQIQEHIQSSSWEITYLVSLRQREGDTTGSLQELLEHAVNAAIFHGMQRITLRVADETPYSDLLHKAGFQVYAREHLYVLQGCSEQTTAHTAANFQTIAPYVRKTARGDSWGLTRLHDASTPRRVQFAEILSSEQIARRYLPSARVWRMPLLEPPEINYVLDTGDKLAGWARARAAWGSAPAQIWMKIHPDYSDLALPFLQFTRNIITNYSKSTAGSGTPVIAYIRDYDSSVIDALRVEGFTHSDTRSVLIRHLTAMVSADWALRRSERSRVNYNVKGLGSVHTSPIETTKEFLHAASDNRRSRPSLECAPSTNNRGSEKVNAQA